MKKLLTALALILPAQLTDAVIPFGFFRPQVEVASGAPDNTLILRLKMDEGTGTSVDDETANNNDFTLSGATWITGKSGSGGALSFDGTDDFLDSDSTINYGTDTITVCAWLKWDSYANDDDLFFESTAAWFSNSGAFAAFPNNSTQAAWYVGLRDGDNMSEFMSRPSATEWHHYAVLIDNSTTSGDIKIWVDGVEQSLTDDLTDKTGSSNLATATLNIMARNAGASLHGAGDLDDFRIYDGELTTEEAEYVRDNPDE